MLSREALIVLHHYVREGLPKTVIAEKLGINRRTVHRYLTDGKEQPAYGPRSNEVFQAGPLPRVSAGAD